MKDADAGNQIKIAANGYFLNFTGELYSESAPEEFTDPESGETNVRMVIRPMKIGELLSRLVAEAPGIEAEKKFTCMMLGGKLYDHLQLKGDAGKFAVTAEQLSLIKTIVEGMNFVANNNGQNVAKLWLKASLLMAIDPSSGKDKDPEAWEWLSEKYTHLPEKVAEWEKQWTPIEPTG